MVAFDFVSKKEDGEKGARMGVHFQILLYKKRRRQGRKGGWFRSTFSPFSLVKKEEKKEKNEDVRVFYSLFFSFLGKWRRKRRSKKRHCVLFSFQFRQRIKMKRSRKITLLFLFANFRRKRREKNWKFKKKKEKMKKAWREKRVLISIFISSCFSFLLKGI